MSKIKQIGIDTIIDLELFARFSMILSYFSGARNRIGFHKFHQEGLYRGNLLTHKVLYNPYIHISKNFESLVNSIKKLKSTPYTKQVVNQDIILPKFQASKKEQEKIIKKLLKMNPEINTDIFKRAKKIVINPNASNLLPLRKWPLENYLIVCKKLIEEGFIILLSGTDDDKPETDYLYSKLNHKFCINMAGKTSLIELFQTYTISDAILSNDSGPVHFASMTNIMIFGLFGPETPKLYGSLKNTHIFYSNFYCSPCVSAYNHRKSACNNNLCLKAIKPEEVYETMIKKLK